MNEDKDKCPQCGKQYTAEILKNIRFDEGWRYRCEECDEPLTVIVYPDNSVRVDFSDD